MKAPTASSARGASSVAWAGFVAGTVCKVYLLLSLSLVLIAILPSLAGWHGTIVQSGSMEPHISPGDVVLTVPLPEDEPVPVGGVVKYRTPAEAEPSGEARTRLHRIVAASDDGTFVTAGDANPDADSVPLERSQITGQARLLIPYVGLPGLWVGDAQWAHLSVWGLFTLAALAIATVRSLNEPEDPSRPHASHSREETGEEPVAASDPELSDQQQGLSDELLTGPGTEQDGDPTASYGRRSLLVLGGASLTGLAFLPRDRATAAFTARTVSAGSSWTVALQPPLTLGRVSGYALFAGTSATNYGFLGFGSDIGGSIGTSPGSSISGFSIFTVDGSLDRNTASARNARTDALALYDQAIARPRTGTVPPILTGTLRPGVYASTGTLLTVRGLLTLDGLADSSSIFILQADTLVAAMDSTVRLINGASADRVFWVVRRTITVDTGSTNQGNYLSNGNAVMQSNSTLLGRLISLNGTISITRATINLPR